MKDEYKAILNIGLNCLRVGKDIIFLKVWLQDFKIFFYTVLLIIFFPH